MLDPVFPYPVIPFTKDKNKLRIYKVCLDSVYDRTSGQPLKYEKTNYPSETVKVQVFQNNNYNE